MSTTGSSSPSPLAAQTVVAGSAPPPHTRHRLWRVTLLGYFTALAAVAIDQLSKAWPEATLAVGERHPVLGDMLAMQLTYSPGAAFSLGASATPLITVLAAAGTLFAAWLTWRTTSLPWALSLGLILGGALGNVIDRLARPPDPAEATSWISSPTPTGSSETSPTCSYSVAWRCASPSPSWVNPCGPNPPHVAVVRSGEPERGSSRRKLISLISSPLVAVALASPLSTHLESRLDSLACAGIERPISEATSSIRASCETITRSSMPDRRAVPRWIA